MNFNCYAAGHMPSDYRCSRCKKTGVKLWREYNDFSDVIKLYCAVCTCELAGEPGIGPELLRPDGYHYTLDTPKRLTDSIGWYVMAVPTAMGVGYWGYTSLPEAGIDWWRKLPNF